MVMIGSPRAVDPIEQAQRGGLARPGGAHHEQQALRTVGEVENRLGDTQRAGVGRFVWNGAKRGRHAALLVVRVDAEATSAIDGNRKVHLAFQIVLRALSAVHDAVQQHAHIGVCEGLVGHRPQLTVDANDGRATGRQVQVRRLQLFGSAEQAMSSMDEARVEAVLVRERPTSRHPRQQGEFVGVGA